MSLGDKSSNGASLEESQGIMELHYGISKVGEANVKTSLHGLSHPYKLVSNWCCKIE